MARKLLQRSQLITHESRATRSVLAACSGIPRTRRGLGKHHFCLGSVYHGKQDIYLQRTRELPGSKRLKDRTGWTLPSRASSFTKFLRISSTPRSFVQFPAWYTPLPTPNSHLIPMRSHKIFRVVIWSQRVMFVSFPNQSLLLAKYSLYAKHNQP